jgi:acetyl-CoA acyltransferase
MSKTAVIVDAVRTPLGRSKGGVFRNVKADKLCIPLVEALFQRNPSITPDLVEEVAWGCVMQTLEQGFNIARFISLQSGIPVDASAQTVNRLCASGLEAINTAARMVMTGEIKVAICGGVEHLGHLPMTHGIDLDETHAHHYAKASMAMGITAEFLSISHEIGREEQDKFAYRSHMLAAKADFSKEIIPIQGLDKDGLPIWVTKDECVRPDTSLEALAGLKSVFYDAGTVTAGNSSAVSDGASAVIVMEEEFAKSLGLKPMARIMGMAAAGVSPAIMGYGPVPAVAKLFDRYNLGPNDIDLVELNEAFAAQAICVLKDLGFYEDMDCKVNLKGGAIALGHPLGCSGARITTTLLHQMQEKNARLGLATMCVGLGQGLATIFERVN